MSRRKRAASPARPGRPPVTDPVVFAYVHDEDVTYTWHQSVMELVFFDQAYHLQRGQDPRLRAGWIRVRYGTGGIIDARNQIAAGFLDLKDDDGARWLFITDTDMGFRPDTLERLIAAADPDERPIMGALCFAQKELAQDGYNGFRCEPRVTLLDWIDNDDETVRRFAGRRAYPRDTVVQVAATGAACLLVHRSVFEKIRAAYGDTWFDRIPDGQGGRLGEDVSFCARAGAVGFPVHVHTGVKTVHQKTLWVGEPDWETTFGEDGFVDLDGLEVEQIRAAAR